MILQPLIDNARLFLLIFVRIAALLQIAPLFSSGAVPLPVRLGMAFFTAFLVLPWVATAGYSMPDAPLQYALLVVGEALIGIIIGFLLQLIFTVFQLAGQLYSLQMGFGASQVFDPLAQIQIPLMGQFINLIALFIFLSSNGLQRLFLTAVLRSFETLRAIDLVTMREAIVRTILLRLSRLFEQALIMSFPILGVLFLIYVTIGLIAKASPQMNLLILGFPFSIAVAFLMLFLIMPFLTEFFEVIFSQAFDTILRIFPTERVGVAQ